MRWKVWGPLAVVVLTAAIGSSIWFWPRRESAELREVKQLQAELQQRMFTPPAETKDTPPPEQRRAKFEELRQKMESLPEPDRKQAEQAMHEGFAKQMGEKLTKFFALSPEEQTAALDKEIDEQEARRKAWGGGPFGPPPGGAPPAASPDRVASGSGSPPAAAGPGSNSAAGAAGNNANGRGGNRPFGPPNWQNMTAEDRKRMQREMLDSTSPEFRAQMGDYIKKIQNRRQERGLPNFGPPA